MIKSKVKVLVACEFSAIVRDAFRDEGFDAISCDLRKCDGDSRYHIRGDVMEVLDERSDDFDLMVAHPPCTYLANSGVRWLYEKDKRWQKMIDGAVFFRRLLDADIPHIAVENPVMHKWAKKVVGYGNYDQSFQPYHFGDLESKRICLWLKNLPKLQYTDNREDEVKDLERKSLQKKYWLGSNHSKERSVFFEGVAKAMAKQWGEFIFG